MLHPELFSVVHALHPVGTGTGLSPMHTMVDWKRLHQTQSFNGLSQVDYYAPGFVAMSQAYLPNPERPPFYCDFIVEMEQVNPFSTPQTSTSCKQGSCWIGCYRATRTIYDACMALRSTGVATIALKLTCTPIRRSRERWIISASSILQRNTTATNTRKTGSNTAAWKSGW